MWVDLVCTETDDLIFSNILGDFDCFLRRLSFI